MSIKSVALYIVIIGISIAIDFQKLNFHDSNLKILIKSMCFYAEIGNYLSESV